MDLGLVVVAEDVRCVAKLPPGWTTDQLWTALVESGNDEAAMQRLPNGDVLVVDTNPALTAMLT